MVDDFRRHTVSRHVGTLVETGSLAGNGAFAFHFSTTDKAWYVCEVHAVRGITHVGVFVDTDRQANRLLRSVKPQRGMVKQTARRRLHVQCLRVCVTVDVDVCVGKCESLSQRTLLVHRDCAVRVVHDQFSVDDGSRAATTQTFAVYRIGIDTVLALVVVVRQVVHAVDDRFLHLLFPHIDALRRVGFAPEQRRAVHTIGAEIVLPRNIGTRCRHLHGSIGQCRGLCRCAWSQAIPCRSHGTH